MKFIIKTTVVVFWHLGFCASASAQCPLLLNAHQVSLQEALQTARENSPVLKTEQYNTTIAETDIITSKLHYNPTFEFNFMNIAHKKYAEPQSALYSGVNNQYALQLGKPFQTAGQRKNRIDIAYKNVVYMENSYAEAERTLLLEVATKWLETWMAQKQLDILTSAKTNMDSLVLANKNRYDNQVITQTDLYRTESLAKQLEIQYKTASQEVANNQRELRFLLGIDEAICVDTTDYFLWDISDDTAYLIEQSLQSRSDVLTAHSFVEVSNSNIRLQKSLANPQPELGVFWNPQNNVPYWGFYASFDLPFFNRNQGEIKKSHLLKQQAEQHLSALQNRLQSEIETAYARYQLEHRNMHSLQAILQQSQTILNNVKYAYLRGGTTIIDFFEAQRSWLETQQLYYETLQNYRLSYIQLLYATGLINQLAV